MLLNSDIINYFLEDEEIAANVTREELNYLHNPDADFLKVLRGALEYQGFNPKAILREMEGEFRQTPNSRMEDCLNSNGPLVKDIEVLIFMFLHRNNHLGKIIKKSLPEIATILEHLRDDDVRKSGTALGVTDITLPRIAGVMPAVAVKLFHLRVVKETVPFLTIPGIKYDDELAAGSDMEMTEALGSKVSNITHAICCPFLPSLHPKAAKVVIVTTFKEMDFAKQVDDGKLILTFRQAGLQLAMVTFLKAK
ncbi:unnamed protein product [Euphydryas editha]|uniref:Uncharacterized protein n=1 Tax=Euphydryas editha TaxID=104508 RepID=A0AAU9TT51_EUPED|nr:unnamed protein product [Euphydryas editha]